MKKYLCEFIGTAVLTLFGCGTAVVTGGLTAGTGYRNNGSFNNSFGIWIINCGYGICNW